MQRNIEFKDFEPARRVTTLVDRLAAKLEKTNRTFSPDAVYLRLIVEHNSGRSLYAISITLDVPRRTVAAKEERHDLHVGIKAAFEEIERQLEKYKENLRKSQRPPKRVIKEARGT
jgi:ribosomal subunit interface protein